VLFQLQLHVVNFFELIQEPRIHRGHLCDLLDRVPLPQSVLYVGQPLRMRRDQPLRQNLRLDLSAAYSLAGIEGANALHQRLFKGASDGHHFADRLHLHAEAFVRSGKFFELPLRNFHDYVIERRSKPPESCA